MRVIDGDTDRIELQQQSHATHIMPISILTLLVSPAASHVHLPSICEWQCCPSYLRRMMQSDLATAFLLCSFWIDQSSDVSHSSATESVQ